MERNHQDLDGRGTAIVRGQIYTLMIQRVIQGKGKEMLKYRDMVVSMRACQYSVDGTNSRHDDRDENLMFVFCNRREVGEQVPAVAVVADISNKRHSYKLRYIAEDLNLELESEQIIA